MSGICSLIFLIGAANLDTLLLSMGRSLRRRPLSIASALLIALTTSLITALSLWAGRWTAGLLGRWAGYVSAALMIAIGLREIARTVLPNGGGERDTVPDNSRDAVGLALVLALNNIGVGVAAGLAGASPVTAGVVNFLAAALALRLGVLLGGHKRAEAISETQADFLSGTVMALLGLTALLR